MSLCYKYSGLNFHQLSELSVYDYRVILINAFTQEANKTEEGKEMIKDYTRISKHNKEIDVESLNNLFGGLG